MAVPNTNVKFSDIWSEANGTYTSGSSPVLSLNTMSFFSYFSGPNGSNTINYNAWGQGEGAGANRIYGTSAKTTLIQVGDFKGRNYFYDSLNARLAQIDATYNGPAPLIPPDAPDAYDFNITLRCYDSSFTYNYISAGFQAGYNFTPTTTQFQINNVSPMIDTYYWILDIDTSPSYPGSAGNVTCDFTINGNAIFSGVTINFGNNNFDSNTYGTANITLNYPTAGRTGSLWDLQFF